MHSEREAPDKSRSWSFANFPGHWSHFNQERRYLMTVVAGKNAYRQIFSQMFSPGLNHCEERAKTKIYNVTLMLIIFLFSFASLDICNTVLRRVLERRNIQGSL